MYKWIPDVCVSFVEKHIVSNIFTRARLLTLFVLLNTCGRISVFIFFFVRPNLNSFLIWFTTFLLITARLCYTIKNRCSNIVLIGWLLQNQFMIQSKLDSIRWLCAQLSERAGRKCIQIFRDRIFIDILCWWDILSSGYTII